jgi:Bacteriophage probable baseplate hub protein
MTQTFVQLEQAHQGLYVPSYKILVNNEDLLTKLFMEIASVQVDNVLKGGDRFSFTVNSTFNLEKREFEHLEDTFAFGNSVLISMGYQDGETLPVMIMGKITAVQTSFPASGLPQINVSGFDLSYCMGKGKKSRKPWHNKTDSYVVSVVAEEYGLKPRVVDTKVQHPTTQQSQESDAQFLERLTVRNGYECFAFKKELFFRPPPKKEETPVVTLEWGKGLLSFSPEINIAEQISKVEVRGWDVNSKKEIIGKAEAGEEPGRAPGRHSGAEVVKKVCREQGELKVRESVFSQQEAKRRAEAILKDRAELFVQGSGESIGMPEIRAGTYIGLTGLGKLFSGSYYIQQCTHTINSSGYRTTFKVKDTTS